MTPTAIFDLLKKHGALGELYTQDSYFNPIQDNADNWIISVEEMEFCTVEQFAWVKDLPLIEYTPKVIELL